MLGAGFNIFFSKTSIHQAISSINSSFKRTSLIAEKRNDGCTIAEKLMHSSGFIENISRFDGEDMSLWKM